MHPSPGHCDLTTPCSWYFHPKRELHQMSPEQGGGVTSHSTDIPG